MQFVTALGLVVLQAATLNHFASAHALTAEGALVEQHAFVDGHSHDGDRSVCDRSADEDFDETDCDEAGALTWRPVDDALVAAPRAVETQRLVARTSAVISARLWLVAPKASPPAV